MNCKCEVHGRFTCEPKLVYKLNKNMIWIKYIALCLFSIAFLYLFFDLCGAFDGKNSTGFYVIMWGLPTYNLVRNASREIKKRNRKL